MNKLLLVEDINNIKNGNYEISYQKNTILNITDKASLNDYNNSSNLEVFISNKVPLNIDKVNILDKDINLVINLQDNSLLNLNWVIINSGKNKVHLTINMDGNSSIATSKVRIINKTKNSNLDFVIDGVINKNTYDNELLEDIKGLILGDDTIKISPNMDVKTNEVMANHLVTIGSFNKDELFYLKSRGLSKNKAQELLTRSFISNIINEDFKERIKMEVKNYE